MDPQNPAILYASFWGDAMYKSTNGGATWTPIMNGIPGTPAAACGEPDPILDRDLAPGRPGRDPVRRLRLDRRVPATSPSRVFKSTDDGASWTMLPAGAAPPSTDNVAGLLRRLSASTTTSSRRRRTIRTSSTPVAQFDYPNGTGGMYPLGRRRHDVDRPRVRPAPGLPGLRLRPARLEQDRVRLGRWRLVQRESGRPACRAEQPEERRQLRQPERPRRAARPRRA